MPNLLADRYLSSRTAQAENQMQAAYCEYFSTILCFWHRQEHDRGRQIYLYDFPLYGFSAKKYLLQNYLVQALHPSTLLSSEPLCRRWLPKCFHLCASTRATASIVDTSSTATGYAPTCRRNAERRFVCCTAGRCKCIFPAR